MGQARGGLRSRARVGALVIGLALALALPSVAMAASAASFTKPAPTSATSSGVARLTISVTVYDRYGVKGLASVSMTLDGTAVKPSLEYLKRGDVRRFRLTFRPTAVPGVGTHKVSVKVRNLKKKYSSFAWTLSVTAAPVVVVPVDPTPSTDPTSSTVPTLPIVPPLPPGLPVLPPVVTPPVVTPPVVTPPGVTPPVVIPPVVTPPVVTPPVVDPPVVAPPVVTPPVVTPPVVDPPVVAPPVVTPPALPETSTPDTTDPPAPPIVTPPADPVPTDTPAVPATPTPPAIVPAQMPAISMAGDCRAAGCHDDANIVAMHKSVCTDCHGDGRPALTAVCTTAGCHAAAPDSLALHPKYLSGHTAPKGRCVTTACHVSNVIALHTGGVGAPGCAACHGIGRPALTLVCSAQGCHPTIVSGATHSGYSAAHVLAAPPTCAGPTCHGACADLVSIHVNEACSPCHKSAGAPLAATCTTLGCHSASDAHPYANPHPAQAAAHTRGLSASCVTTGCHAPDLVALHSAAMGCATCHAAGRTATGNCTATGCHPSNGSPMHDAHQSTVTTATFRINNLNYGTYACASCHGSMDLIALHGGRGSCGKCHPGAADSASPWNGGCDQPACHGPSSARPMHANLQTAHLTAVQPGCTRDGCHFGNSSVGGRDVILVHYAKDKCTTCHGPGKTPTIDCIQCHPQAATGDHQSDHQACNDCHQPYVWDPATSTANKGAYLTSGVHWSLFDASWTLLIGRAVIRPGYPKGDYTMLVFPGVIGTPGPYTSLPYFDRTGTYTCTTCHTGAGKTWVHPGSSYFTCGSGGDCHQHHGNWDPAQNSDTYVHNTPPASWTQVMKW